METNTETETETLFCEGCQEYVEVTLGEDFLTYTDPGSGEDFGFCLDCLEPPE